MKYLILKERWFWRLVVIYFVILVVPIVLAWVIISMLMQYPIVVWSVVVALIVFWLLFRSYRGQMAKNREPGEDAENV